MRRSRHVRRLVCAFALAAATSATISPAQATAQTRGSGFEADRSRVKFAGSVTLRGAFQERVARPVSAGGVPTGETRYASRPARNQSVRILYKTVGAKSWNSIGRTRTGKAGRYKKNVRLRRTGYLRAKLADGTMTAKRRVTVRSTVRPKVKQRHVDTGAATRIAGRVNPGTSGRKVTVKVGRHKQSTRTRSGGRFAVRIRLGSTGTRRVIVRAKGDRAAKAAKAAAGRVTAYRRAMASWYGPGLYGNRMACGGTLGYDTVGVAHRTMPCGTKLRIRYGKRTITTRVIDRGPFHSGREFDLTGAAKRKLGFGSTGYIQVNK